MKTLNRVFLMGHLGAAPELSHSKSGKPYARLSLATNRSWAGPEDKEEKATDWHSVFVWGQLAELCVQYLRKGSPVFVEGSLTYWQVNEQHPYRNAIRAHEVQFLNSGKTLAGADQTEGLDNSGGPRNHNAVAHPA